MGGREGESYLHQEEIVEKNSGNVARSMMIFWEILSGITDMVDL